MSPFQITFRKSCLQELLLWLLLLKVEAECQPVWVRELSASLWPDAEGEGRRGWRGLAPSWPAGAVDLGGTGSWPCCHRLELLTGWPAGRLAGPEWMLSHKCQIHKYSLTHWLSSVRFLWQVWYIIIQLCSLGGGFDRNLCRTLIVSLPLIVVVSSP